MRDIFGPWVAFFGLVGMTVGLIALAKGKLEWARIRDRKGAGLVAGIGFIWLAFGVAVTPTQPTDVGVSDPPAQEDEVRETAKSSTRLALDKAEWQLVDAEATDISGSAEPGATIAATWSGGSTSTTAGQAGIFTVPVGPISQLGETSVKVVANVEGKEPASAVATINKVLSEGKFKAAAQSIPYDQLKKDPDALIGTVVTYKGEIFQYDSRTTTSSMIISVTNKGYGFWSDEMHLLLDPALGANADENDLIQIWGRLTGSYTYETAMGGSNTLPQVLVQYLTVTSKK